MLNVLYLGNKQYFRKRYTRSTTPWEWLYRTEPNLRFINELNARKRKEQSKKGEKPGKQKELAGLLKFADNERLVIDDKLPAYERTYLEYDTQIDAKRSSSLPRLVQT